MNVSSAPKEQYKSIHHSFDANLAKKIGGPDLAIFIHHIQYWMDFNERLKRNFHEGKYWTYQTFQELCNHFPYWSIDQIRTIIKKLVAKGILVKGSFNKDKYDHTVWYSIDYENTKSIWENSQIDNAEIPKGIGENPKPIPDNIPYNNNNVVVVAQERAKEESFTKDDVYAACVRLRRDWEPAEIEEAWEIYSKSDSNVTSPFDYIEGIIENKRLIKKSKTNKHMQKRNISCSKKKQMKEPNKELHSSKEQILEKGTQTRCFANWRSKINGDKS